MLDIDRGLSNKKEELLRYFRGRASESLDEIGRIYGNAQFRKSAAAINKAIISTKDTLIKTLAQTVKEEQWSNDEVLRCVLMITQASYVVMLESRNEVWPYDYMSFSRRVGELWEPFCKLCFEFPLSKSVLFVPPLFSEVKKRLTNEIDDYIHQLRIPLEQKKDLKRYYSKVWSMIISGEIQLELDLHFMLEDEKYVVDFKSGFGSNEKGNTNRLLMVATIYGNLEENYHCLLLVRASEDKNNTYFQTLNKDTKWLYYLLAFFNSPTCNTLLRTINPSANNSANYIKKLPFIVPEEELLVTVNNLVKEIIADLKQHGLYKLENEIAMNKLITDLYGF